MTLVPAIACEACGVYQPAELIEPGPHGQRACSLCRSAFVASAQVMGSAEAAGVRWLVELADGALLPFHETEADESILAEALAEFPGARVHRVGAPFSIEALASSFRRDMQGVYLAEFARQTAGAEAEDARAELAAFEGVTDDGRPHAA